MPILTLKFKDNLIREVDLAPGASATIGRLEDNTIVIENLAVSGHHAKIEAVGEGYLYIDLQSKNGSFVNNRQVATHWLSHEDVIRIGKHTLVFTHKLDELQERARGPKAEATVMMSAVESANPVGDTGDTDSASEPVGVLAYLAGGDGDIELVKKLTTIGREAGSDIRVEGWTIGRTAATISRRPNGYYLSYVGGLSKPRINGKPVKASAPLNEFDIVEVGPAKLQFFTRE